MRTVEDGLISVLQQVFPHPRFETKLVNARRSVVIKDNDETNIYLRIACRPTGIVVEISSIILDPTLRRQKYFTRLVTRLRGYNAVDKIIVSGVLTDEMHSACRKLGSVPSESYAGYIMNKECD